MGQRRNPEALKEWYGIVKDACEQEIAMWKRQDWFPYPYPVRLRVLLGHDIPVESLHKDGDNCFKAIADAIKGVLIPDDCAKYIRSGFFDFFDSESSVTTFELTAY